MAPAENRLIELLPVGDRERFVADCELVEITRLQLLSTAGEPTEHVYFPRTGFIALVATLEGGAGIEVGMAGPEGMLGAQVILGVTFSPLRAIVVGPGNAWRISTQAFHHQLLGNPALSKLLRRYVAVVMKQLTTSVACVRYHEVGPRLARWLLMSQDRAQGDSFRVTQEFLAFALGVRRVSISNAAGIMQHGGLIEYVRGDMTVVDRSGLEEAACGCYHADIDSYKELLI